jgi:hypothetical protein
MVLRGADRCYAKDFMLMSIDPRTEYACFH